MFNKRTCKKYLKNGRVKWMDFLLTPLPLFTPSVMFNLLFNLLFYKANFRTLTKFKHETGFIYGPWQISSGLQKFYNWIYS